MPLRIVRRCWKKAALNFTDEIEKHDLKKMDHVCLNCNAFKFSDESEGFCYLEGKVKLAPFPPIPGNSYVLKN
jgi:hypothetical protein